MSESIHLTGLAIIVAELTSLITWMLLRPKPQPDTWLAFFSVAGVGTLICMAAGAVSALVLPPLEGVSELPVIAAAAALGVGVVLYGARATANKVE